MGFKGDLSSFHLADVFQTLTMSQKEGTLVVVDGEVKKSIHFGRGSVRLVMQGGRKSMRVGERLVRTGTITSFQLDAALNAAKTSNRRLGEVLVVMGAVSQETVDSVVRSQIEEEIYDLFWWQKAQFEFIDGPAPDDVGGDPHAATSLAFDVNALLFEAIRRLDEWARLTQVVSDFSAVYAATEEANQLAAERRTQDGAQREVLLLCDGGRTVQEVIQTSTLGRFETLRVICASLEAGLLVPADADHLMRMSKRLQESGERERALAAARGALALRPDDLGLLEATAEQEAALGKAAEASQTYLRLASTRKVAGDAAGAVRALARAAESDPKNFDARLALCRQHADAAENERAEALVRPLARDLIAAGRAEEARDLCAWAIPFATEPVDLHVLRARAHLALQARELARETLQGALSCYPPGDKRKFEALLKRVQALTPDCAELVALAEGMVVRKVRDTRAVKLALAVIALLALLIGAGLWYRDLDARGRAALEATRIEADRLLREGKWEEARALYWKIRDENGLSSISRAAADAAAEIERQHKAEIEKRAQEEAARREQQRREIAAKKVELQEAVSAEKDGKELDPPLQAFRAIEKWAQKVGESELEKQARAGREKIERHLEEAKTLAEMAAAALREDRVPQANEAVRKLWWEYGRTPSARAAAMPIQVLTQPPGAAVKLGKTDVGKSPVVVPLPYLTEKATLTIEASGFLPHIEEITPTSGPQLTFALEKIISWNLRTRGPIEGKVALHGDRVFVGSRDGQVYAADAVKGDPAWTFQAGDPGDVIGSVIVHGDSLYFGSNDRCFYRVSLADGKKRWQYPTGLFVQGTPLVLDDPPVAIVGSHDKRLHGVHRDTGKGLWTVPTNGTVTGQPALYGGAVLFAAEDEILRAVDPANGKVLWQLPCGSEVLAAPVVAGERAYLGTKSGKLLCIDLTARKTLWTYNAGGPIAHALDVESDRVYCGTLDGWVHGVRREDGLAAWPPFQAGGGVSGGIAQANGTLYTGCRDAHIYALDAATGTLLWKVKTRAALNGIPRVENGWLYLGSDEGQLHAVELK